MQGTRVATLDDRQVGIKVEVWKVNTWYFSRYKAGTMKVWRDTPKPYRNTLGAIRGAYYSGTGLI